jgi:hypothetical protein
VALGPEDSVRQAVLASVAAEWKGAAPFLCVDVVSPPADRGTKFWHIRLVGTDPSAKAFPRLDDDLPAMVPRSACTVGAEYDGPIVLRATPKTGGATVSLGPVSWLNGEDARIVVLTWAGGLSHTFAEWKVQKENGAWVTRGSSIILQE